jgi:ankyrin repeat protein
MNRADTLSPRFILPALVGLIVALVLVGCENPKKRALSELSKRGIEPTGQALLEAVIAKDSLRVGWLLDAEVGTEPCDITGRTPLRIASENGDSAAITMLLGRHANVNALAADHSSLLAVAIARDDTALALNLIKRGIATDGSMPNGEKILPWATQAGQLTSVRAMIEAGADPRLKNRAGDPLLHIAMASGKRDMVDSILKLGGDSAATNHAGETTIQLALRQNWPDLIPQLIAAGADPNSRDAKGISLLGNAVLALDKSQIKLLLENHADPFFPISVRGKDTPVERAIESGNAELFSVFLNHGCRPLDRQWDRWLWRALACRNREMMHAMLRLGAHITTRNRERLLMVEAATQSAQGSLVKLLLDYSQPAGDSLAIAVKRGDRGMVQLLLACGVNVNQTHFPSSETPLSLAILGRQDLIAVTLLEQDADIDLILPEGQPALHLAIARGCHNSVQALLNRGADANELFKTPVSPEFLKQVRPGIGRWVLKNDARVTPLMIAVDSGLIPSVRHLLAAGARTEIWTRTTRLWPLNFASARSDVKMMRLILGKDPQREERQLVIRLSEQKARLLDAAGNELFITKISSGRKGFATPTGNYVITNKNRDWTSTIYHASMPYFQRLNCSDFGLHQGNLPGYPASHGCIRLPAKSAAKLYSLTQAGDRVTISP